MTRLVCIGLDYTAANTAERASAWNEDRLRALKDEGRILEGLLLTTCNRSEVYLRLPPDAETPSELTHPKARVYSGTELSLHLLRVLLGLESLACGESHIAAQVKACYAEGNDLCGPWLHRLFQSSLKMAKLLRTCYHPGMEPSIPRLMVDMLAPSSPPSPLSVLVLGAGEMGEETSRLLLSLPLSGSPQRESEAATDGEAAPRAALKPAVGSLVLSNRTPDRTEALLSRLLPRLERESGPKVTTLPWEQWREASRRFDAIFFCTGSPVPLFSMEDARPGQQIFDLGSPPQVVRSAEVAGARLVAIDDLARTAEEATKRYRKKLRRLEEEAANAAVSVMSELETLSGETYKRLVLHRAERIVADRAERTSKRTGTDEETLRRMGWSIVKALLSPAFAESDPHARRLWKILAGELEESDDV